MHGHVGRTFRSAIVHRFTGQEFTIPVKDIKAHVVVELNRELAASGALRRVMSAPPVEL